MTENIAEKLRAGVIIFLGLLILGVITGGLIYKSREYHRLLKALTSMKSDQVTIFRVYHRGHGGSEPREFKAPDVIIHDFFVALNDIQSYHPPGRDTAEQDQQWFMEIGNDQEIVQVAFYIPAQIGGVVGYRQGGDRVVGEIMKVESHSPYYGRFQSQRLLQWYQQYHKRWEKVSFIHEEDENTYYFAQG